jgi:exosortase B
VSTIGAPALASAPSRLGWALVFAGLASLYAPVYWNAAQELWPTDEHAHGPLILMVVAFLFWRLREPIAALPDRPASWLGGAVFALGVLLYLPGQVFGVGIFKFLSQPFVIAGILLLLKGPAVVRIAWFPLLYLLFSVPLPGVLVDAATGQLKQAVSVIVEQLLFAAGYPIAREGVTMTVGQYQLLVADACSGLNSMFSLSALGVLFMHLMARKNRLHNAVMLLSILPIAFCANIVRVIVLILVTYHLGDEAGQGFLHGAAGMVLMLASLTAFFTLDAVLKRVLPAAPSHPGASLRGPVRPAETP